MKRYFVTVTLLCFVLIGKGQNGKVKPVNFLKDIVSQFPNVRDIAFSPFGDEICFTVQSYMSELSAIVCVKKELEKFSIPKVASFSGRFNDLEPFFSPDGLRLYFASDRPLNDSINVTKDYDIWYVERKSSASKWSLAKNIGLPINTLDNEFFPSICKANHLYFTSDGKGTKGKDDIFVSKWNGTMYEVPISLSDSINSEGMEFNAFIEPDESFLIFTGYKRPGGFGSGDLYISFNRGNDVWSKAENMGPIINSSMMDYCPFVKMDSGILYFTSKRNGISPNYMEKQTLSDLKKQMNVYENGLSRIYQIKFNPTGY